VTAIYEEELRKSAPMVLKEADELYEGRGRLLKTYRRLAGRLDDVGVAHSLVGGYALIVHGVRRFTEDLDLVVTADGLAHLREDLLGRGYVAVLGSERSIRDAETGVRIDFVISGGFPGDGKPKPVVFPAPDLGTETPDGLRVVDLATLIDLKLASGMTAKGRLQDLADVQRLIQAHDLGDDFAEKLNPYVRDKFRELCEES